MSSDSDNDDAAIVAALFELFGELVVPFFAWFTFSPWFVFWPGCFVLAAIGLECCTGGA